MKSVRRSIWLTVQGAGPPVSSISGALDEFWARAGRIIRTCQMVVSEVGHTDGLDPA